MAAGAAQRRLSHAIARGRLREKTGNGRRDLAAVDQRQDYHETGHMSYLQDMRPETWVEDLLGTRGRVRVLRALAGSPGRMWTERELARHLRVSPNTVNMAVRALRDAGVVEFRRLGRSHGIRLRPGLVLAQRIEELFAGEARTLQDALDAGASAVPARVACLLYGSTARGDASADSDVDLLVVGRTIGEAEDAAGRIREAMEAVFPLRLSIAALDGASLRKRPREPWLRNALSEGRLLSKTGLEAFQ